VKATYDGPRKLADRASPGRQSIYFGIQGDVPDVWECNGKALAGFAGANGGYINGLMVRTPRWLLGSLV
jgi:hypothetical protein